MTYPQILLICVGIARAIGEKMQTGHWIGKHMIMDMKMKKPTNMLHVILGVCFGVAIVLL